MPQTFTAKVNNMQERLENCIKKFQINTLNAKSQQNLFFGKKNAAEKFSKLNNCLAYLKKYKDEISNLIEINRENKDYFEAHRATVVNLLEQVENRKFNLQENDFKLVIPQIKYKETNLKTFNNYLKYTSLGFAFLGIAFCLAASIVACLSFPPFFILPAVAGAIWMGLVITAAVSISLAGIGGIVSYGIDSSLECEEKYSKGSGFDTDLIMEAYAILYKETGNACNQAIDLGEQDLNQMLDEELHKMRI